MLKKANAQRGDTIVEVLIAIVVVSLVLVTAYVTTTRNVNGIQDTEEHSEALQLAQTQLEFLHNSSSTPTNHKCFDSNGAIVGDASCLVDSSGTPTAGQPQFKLDITQVNSATFEVAVTWTSLDQDSQTNSVDLFYQP